MSAIYRKPNGKEVEVHEKSIDYVESLGWEKTKDVVQDCAEGQPDGNKKDTKKKDS